MKKFTFILAACCCLFLASCNREDSCTYIIEHAVISYSATGLVDSEAAKIKEEFTKEVIAFDKAHQSDWKWTVTVKNENYDNSDEEAIAKYKQYETELEAINKKYIDKFAECTGSDYNFKEVYYLKLSRVSVTDAVLGYKEFTISSKQ